MCINAPGRLALLRHIIPASAVTTEITSRSFLDRGSVWQWICTFAPGNLISFSGAIKLTVSQCVSLLSLKNKKQKNATAIESNWYLAAAAVLVRGFSKDSESSCLHSYRAAIHRQRWTIIFNNICQRSFALSFKLGHHNFWDLVSENAARVLFFTSSRTVLDKAST